MSAQAHLEAQVLQRTGQWLDRAVIGLNLCPFAKAVRRKRQIRFVVCPARRRNTLLQALADEALRLAAADPLRVDTTLLIHPFVLTRFADYNDFLDPAEALLGKLGLDGVLQLASFHPRYRFADATAQDPANLSNRSPYPMLHLLREDSVSRAVGATQDADQIVARNIDTLRTLGHAGWQRLFDMP